MSWSVDPSAERPPSKQILDYVLQRIVCGDLDVGDPLPPVRKMAAEARVSHNTVLRAWRELEELEVLRTRPGSGVFIAQGGHDVAVAHVLEGTLAMFEKAAKDALRVGHAHMVLTNRLEKLRGGTT